jgi:tRNA pseudouridine55 synthase
MRGHRSAAAVRGVLNLDKPTGVTSREVVDRVARPLRGVKVGHAGTLDPLASGVLVVCVGAATRLIEFVQRMPKTYRTAIRLGATSDTLDADGHVVAVASPRVPKESEVLAALAGQVGTIEQRPPAFSALKVAGRRAYDLARAGLEVELAPRPVTIDRIDLLGYQWPRLELKITCGGGTFIRSIARDVGEALGCGGLVEVLVRTGIGPYTQAEAIDPMSLTAESIPGLLRPAAEAVAALPAVRISAGGVAAIARGRALGPREWAGAAVPAGEVALLGPDGALVAIAEGVPEAGLLHPRRVLASG